MLKGKLRDEFEDFVIEHDDLSRWAFACGVNGITFEEMDFNKLPFEMQKGVYEAFLKYKDYRIEIVFGIDLKTNEFDGYDWSILKVKKDLTVKELYSGWNEFENEAFEEAINKLNEILG